MARRFFAAYLRNEVFEIMSVSPIMTKRKESQLAAGTCKGSELIFLIVALLLFFFVWSHDKVSRIVLSLAIK